MRSTRIYNRRPFALRLHVDRLYRSLRELRIPITYSFEELAGLHELLIEKKRHRRGQRFICRSPAGSRPGATPFPKTWFPG